MNALMMEMPLMISSLIRHADDFHGDTEIVSRLAEGGTHRYTYADAHRRSRQLANALTALGVSPGMRVGTLAWNNHRHFELYFGVSGIGAVCHTVNPRLFPEQIIYIINHAEDGVIFFDLSFLPLVDKLAAHCAMVKTWVLMAGREHLPQRSTLAGLVSYEDLIDSHSDQFSWPEFDENTASSLCYTSGTTGNPKGVLYSHRSTILHAYAGALPDVVGASARDVVLPVVPMFHVNAWGIPYSAPMVGSKLVFPGPHLDGKSLYEMFEQEGVTYTAGVPTIWLALLNFLQQNKLRLTTLKRASVGGAACPPAIIKIFQEEFGVAVLHGWGMTETSPLGTLNSFKAKHAGLSGEERLALQAKQGRGIFGVQMKIVDDQGKSLPRDGQAFGDLLVRGPWVASGYFKNEGGEVLLSDANGRSWFPTGDVATIDADGYMQITDRSKDVIKSGGEWISSIELENIAVGHPAVAEAAVIGVHHPKWDERPLLLVVRKPGAAVSREELLALYQGRIAHWWLPDDVVFVDSLPHTATGKLLKTKLREDFRAHAWPAP
ncbi:MAG TPA: 3-(methylthio)propionyl-CoA ligase [Rhodocyclaceae bacterium]|nr:3-(methylthio)propionyl-CoA ligase [Rhodocyclaceae bacterium]